MEGEKQTSSDNKQEQTASNDEKKDTASNNEQEKPGFNNYEGAQTVDTSNLKVGDMINGHAIDKLTYKKGDQFGIGLKGEFTVTGELSYDEEFWGGVILSIDEASASPTKIKFKFDEEFVCALPSGTFIIDGADLDAVNSVAPGSFMDDIKNGATYKTKLVIKDYAFAAKNNTSPWWSGSIVKIIDFEMKNEPDKTTETSSKFSSETINGKEIGFNSDETVIVPMYNGINKSKLTSVTEIIGSPTKSDMTMKVNFAVFGKLQNVVVTYYEGMGSDGIPTELAPYSNANVTLQVYAPSNDMTYLKVTGQVHGEASLIDVEFTLDDMRDPSDYEIIAY